MFTKTLRIAASTLALACGLSACGQSPATTQAARQVTGASQALTKKGELGTLTLTSYRSKGKAPEQVQVQLGFWGFYNTQDGWGPFTQHAMNDINVVFTLSTDKVGLQKVEELEVWRTDRDGSDSGTYPEQHVVLVHQGQPKVADAKATKRTRAELEWIANGVKSGKIFGKLYTFGELSAASKALLREQVAAALAALPKP